MSQNIELEKVYDPKAVEGEIFGLWERSGAFNATPDKREREQRFVVMIPLPNVTGTLHLGHAINNTLQDVMTRWHRMRGFNSLYQPGTDHAGIATQAVVEKRIFEEEKKSRHDLGREELVRRIWEWKEQYEGRILSQLKSMGCSCDWQRVRFTLDEKYNEAVLETFFQWFKAGLIYRGERLVNWDSHLRTAVADDEVYHETVKGQFWHFKYPIKNPPDGGPAHVGFATTRPETMLGDVALAVNPADERYRALVGRTALVPLFDPPREIPILADEWADPQKGTGCVKITPAHDPNDYQVGLRHKLPMLNMMTADGRVSAVGGKYEGMPLPEARKATAAAMESLGLLDKVEQIEVDLPHSDRSKTPIEPFLSPQWFVRMGNVDNEPRECNGNIVREGIKLPTPDGRVVPGLAQAAIDAVTSGQVKVFPERYARTYLDWLGEKRDWCISRQLWWGHRIPVWSCVWGKERFFESFFTELQETHKLTEFKDYCKRMQVIPIPGAPATAGDSLNQRIYICLRREPTEACAALLAKCNFQRDPDVLDTWFSSQLWPYATLGWPEKTADLDYFYPGTVLITSRDIITLWVARMVLSGLYNCGQVPFRNVYIHPKILDGRGETMSKSKGNGVDPLDIIEMYGADALRYSLADMTTETQDVRMPVEYRCPHCAAMTPQTTQNMQAKSIACHACAKKFATRWADAATATELGLAQIVSEKFEIGRNFCNKLWNAARFAFMNLQGVTCKKLDLATLPTEDRWILAQLSHTIVRLHGELSVYRYASSIKLLRDFFWDNLCDWYIELTKARMNGGEKGPAAQQVLAFCLDQVLRLLHPFLPFITERLWRQLNAVAPKRGLPKLAEPAASALLITAEFPPSDGWPKLQDEKMVRLFESLQAATRGVRELRNRHQLSPKQKVRVTIDAPPESVAELRATGSIVERLAGVESLVIDTDVRRPRNAGTLTMGLLQIHVHDVSNDEAELARLQKEIVEVNKQIVAKETKLSNEGFARNAKAEVVSAERERYRVLLEQRTVLEQSLALLR